MGVSFSELLILLGMIFGGSFGLPMGLPPGPEDPLMYKIAPEDCLFYATWTGVSAIDKNANPTEAWIAQPEIQKSFEKLRGAFRGAVVRQIDKARDPAAKKLAGVFLEVAEAAARNPAAFYVTDAKLNMDMPVLNGAAMIGLGEFADKIELAIRELEGALNDESEIKQVSVEGESTFQFTIPETGVECSFAIRGRYFVIGLGEGALSKLAANSKTDPPKWLSQAKQEMSIDRFASMSFLDTRMAVGALPKSGFREQLFGDLATKLLTDDVESIAWVSGLDSKGFLTRCSLRTKDKLTGILASIDGKPISRKQLLDIPADSTMAIATRLSAKEILRIVTETARGAGGEESLKETLGQFQQVTGVSLEKELIDSLGDYIEFHYQLDVQNFSSGWFGTISIEDEMSFPAIFDKINRGLERSVQQQGGQATFSRNKVDGNEIFTINDDRWTQVAWTLVDDKWYFAPSADKLTTFLKGGEKTNRLSEHESVKQLYDDGEKLGLGPGPVAIADLNLASIINGLKPFWMMVEGSDQEMSPDFDFRFSDIPDFEILLNGLKPNITAIYRTEDGFQIVQRQTYPGASPGVTIAAASALGMPYAAAQFDDVKKVKVNNNLRMLGLAFHNFESVFGSFPAAYTMDADGKPLLSWRVHLLPYLEQAELYQQFHLDEPWDSEHNKALIEKMPDLFTHPTLKLEKGMTVYLAVTGDNGVFSKPVKAGGKEARGVRGFRDVTDGTSNTVMLVEVNKQNAEPWTKPADVSTDGAALLEKTKGIRAGDEFSVVTTDGASMTLGRMTAKRLSAILGINDGELIGDLYK